MFLKNMLTIGKLDLNMIENYYNVIADRFDFLALEEVPIGKLGANIILYELFCCINHEVFSTIHKQLTESDVVFVEDDEAKHKWIKRCKKRIYEFSPFMNSLDSWFQNELDQIDMTGRKIEEIAQDVIHLWQ